MKWRIEKRVKAGGIARHEKGRNNGVKGVEG
jgi:hypothetical protein